MFLDEIAKILELDGSTGKTHSCLLFDTLGVHIEGRIVLGNFSSVRVDFLLNKEPYCVLGEDLKIKNLTKASLSIKGRIYGIINSKKITI